jgi:hypothetical protein
MIKAKPVIPDQYWILRDDQGKIGNIEADASGYVVSVNGTRSYFDNLNKLCEQIPVEFQIGETRSNPDDPCQVHGYPTPRRAYNAVFDVQHQLPLWTTEPRSRSWFAAGWYRVRQHRRWKIMQCPKLIILQRYDYQGPFHTLQQAQSA